MAKGGINKVILVGNCCADPETRYLPSGGAVTSLSIATNESWKDKQTGQQQERAEFHKIVFFNRLAEIAGEYLRKGRKVYVEGSLRTRKWQDQNGQDRWTTEIVASDMLLIDGNRNDENAPQDANAASHEAQRPAQRAPAGCDFSDDIPFSRVMNCHAI